MATRRNYTREEAECQHHANIISNLIIMFCFNPVGFGHILQIEMKHCVAAEVSHWVSDEAFASIACLIVNQLKVRELHFNCVLLHSATQAKLYSSLQPGGGAGPHPPPGMSMSFKLRCVTNVLVICLEAGHSSPSCVCICMCVSFSTVSMGRLVCFPCCVFP